MARLINPILYPQGEYTLHKDRFFSMASPIQKTKSKQADYMAYICNPAIDLVLTPFFLLDIGIHLLNCVTSLVTGLFKWTKNQKKTPDPIDEESKVHFTTARTSLELAISSLLSAVLNPIFSAISLITRPIASFVQAFCENNNASFDLNIKFSA